MRECFGVTSASLVVRNCEIHKAIIGYFNNANSVQAGMLIYNNSLSYIPQPAIHIRALTGTSNVGNTWSWEIYGNRIEHGNLSSGWGGALAYIQCRVVKSIKLTTITASTVEMDRAATTSMAR